jgi:hypothetical protein
LQVWFVTALATRQGEKPAIFLAFSQALINRLISPGM